MDNQVKFQIGSFYETKSLPTGMPGCIAKITYIVEGQRMVDVALLQRHSGELSHLHGLSMECLNPEPMNRDDVIKIVNIHIDRLRNLILGV